MPNLKCIALSAYKSNGYIHKYIFGPPKFKYANSKRMRTQTHIKVKADVFAGRPFL